MCPWTELRSQGEIMIPETFQKILPYLPLARNIDFTGGGEPLVNDGLPEMIRQAKTAGCQVGFSTNGIRLTPEASKEFIHLGLDWISFSVDAATAEKYERIRQGAKFGTVTANIAALRDLKRSYRQRKPSMMMVFVALGGEADTSNYHELPAYIELAKELGVEQVIVKNLDVILKEEDDQRRLFRHGEGSTAEIEEIIQKAELRAKEAGIKLRRYRLQPQEQAVCEHNPIASLFINWEGWVSPCITHAYAEERVFAGEWRQPVCQRFGNVNETSLEEIWNLPQYADFRRKFLLRQQAERRQLVSALLNEDKDGKLILPDPPEGCESCYYLYGV